MIILTINQSNHMEKEHSGHQLHLAVIEIWEKKISEVFWFVFFKYTGKKKKCQLLSITLFLLCNLKNNCLKKWHIL